MSITVSEQRIPQLTPIASDYQRDFETVASYFHYSPFNPSALHERKDRVLNHQYPRKELSVVLRQYHQKWGISQKVNENLHKLEQEDSVVIIGGQQAGLLLGPLYTLHKVITILQLAKQKEQELNVPVVPVFWIAGEDHDYDEINHIYLSRADTPYLDKYTLEHDSHRKESISSKKISPQRVEEWVNTVFEQLPETEFTPDLKSLLQRCLHRAETYVDFFAAIMHELFSAYGLLMIDSANHDLRKLESQSFQTIIRHYSQIDQHVRQAIQHIEASGYQAQVHVGKSPALLFIYEQGERLLLEKKEDHFQTKDGKYTYTEEQLLQVAEQEPWKLSNNVITRPFMQESLFPTLGFVGGPGEIAYWALYKPYFEHLGLTLPVIFPRMSMTLIEKPIAKIMEKRQIPWSAVFENFQQFRQEWIQAQDDLNLEERFKQVRDKIEQAYEPLLQSMKDIPGMDQLGEKNVQKVMDQISFLEKRATASFQSQHDVALRQFDKVEQALCPQQNLQERVHNPFTFFNKHGILLVEELLHHELHVNGKHKVIHL